MVDNKLFMLVGALITIGILATYSLSTFIVVHFEYHEFHFVLRQLIFGFGSIAIMWVLAQLDPAVWLRRLGFGLFFSGLFLMIIMPFMPGEFVTDINGAKRWIKVLGFSLAPVEFFKIGFVYFLAWSFSRKVGHHAGMGIREELIRFLPYAVVFLLVMFLIAFMQNDLGQVVVLGLTLALMFLFAGSSFKFFVTLVAAALLFFVFFIVTAEHRVNRIMTWWSLAQNSVLAIFPESIARHLRVESVDGPSQIGHSLNAIHNGGLFGVGIGNGTFKLGFLSEVHTDFVLAGIAEETGFFGLLVVTLLFVWLLQRIFRVANRSERSVDFLFSIGVGLLLALAFLINAFGISGLTPIKGIAVPFLSYGGSSMVAASIGIGMVLMISKRIDHRSGRIRYQEKKSL